MCWINSEKIGNKRKTEAPKEIPFISNKIGPQTTDEDKHNMGIKMKYTVFLLK